MDRLISKADGESPRSLHKSFRQLIDQLDVELRFGSAEGLESACHELLSRVRMDTYEASIRNEKGELEVIAFSSNPEAVYEKMLKYNKKVAGAYLNVDCGHCGQNILSKSTFDVGVAPDYRVKSLIDNFPEEL